MNEYQTPGEKEARKCMFQVKLNTAPGGRVPRQSIGYSKHSDVAMGKRIFQEADSHAQKCAKDSVPSQ